MATAAQDRCAPFRRPPNFKAQVYAELGVNVIYDPTNSLVIAEAPAPNACATVRVGEPSCKFSYQGPLAA